jgi:hypothetical protein
MQKGACQQLTEKHRGVNGDWTGPRSVCPRLTGLAPFSWRFDLLFDLDAPLSINSSYAEGPLHPFTREPPTWKRSTGGSRRTLQILELPRRWPRTCPSRHGCPYMVKPWWNFGATPCIHQGICTFNIRWWYNRILSLLWVTSMRALFICVDSICP